MKTERKRAASEGLTREQNHSALMREMDSPNGAWNPEPEDHILGTLRTDVELSPNEIKLIALVKFCCVRLQGKLPRTAWGKMEGGKPLTIPRAADFFGWDPRNTLRHAQRPLAYGFIRQNADGVLGLGARVDGQFDDRRIKSEDSENQESHRVCTYPIPEYLFADSKRLSEKEREKFVTEWSARKEAAKQRLNDEVARLRLQEQIELRELCESFGLELKTGKKRRGENGSEAPGAERDENGYVQTETLVPANGYVQTAEKTLYKVENGSVHTRPYIGVQRTENTEKTLSVPGPEIDRELEGEWVSEKPPLTHSLSEVATTLEQAGFPVAAADPLLAKFEALSTEHQIPARSVCRAIQEKTSQKKAKGQRIVSAGALYEFVKADMRQWIARNSRAIAGDAPRAVEAEDPNEHARWLEELQARLDDPDVDEAEKKIIRRVIGTGPR